MAKLADYPFPKVIDAYPGADGEGMIALGLANGKVILATFGASVVVKEFGMMHMEPEYKILMGWVEMGLY